MATRRVSGPSFRSYSRASEPLVLRERPAVPPECRRILPPKRRDRGLGANLQLEFAASRAPADDDAPNDYPPNDRRVAVSPPTGPVAFPARLSVDALSIAREGRFGDALATQDARARGRVGGSAPRRARRARGRAALVSNLAGWEANSSASASCRGWRSLSSWTGTTSASTTSAWYPAASDEASRWQRRSASTMRQFTSGASASVAAGTPQEVDLAEDDEGAGRLPEDEATGARVDAASEARSPSPTAPTSPRPVASEMARPLEYMVPVRAYYVGNFIDFHALAKRLPSYPKDFSDESVIVRMTPRRASEDDGAGVGARTETGEGHTLRADADASAAFGDVPASAADDGGASLFRGV